MKEKRTIVVWFSCGAASAVAAKKTIELYSRRYNIVVVNNPISNEDDDNFRFLKDIEKWLGTKIYFAKNSKYPEADCVEVWEDRRYMSGIVGAPCTMVLKKEARQQWEAENNHSFLVLGFTSEEEHRADRFRKFERANLVTPLIDLKLTKGDCFRLIQDAGIELPRIYKMGYPNANCIGCVKSSSPTYWNHVRKMHPEIFEQRSVQSRDIGARLVVVKGERLFLDELDPKAKGRPMKDMDFECGIFCETK